MQNSNKLENSKGAVLFAFNSETVDYVSIADQTSRLIKHNLGLPVTLITDTTTDPKFAYDHIVRTESQSGNRRLDLAGQSVEWKNFGRYLAYDLSPYKETILLDSDYLILDDSLNRLWDCEFDYQLQHHNITDNVDSYEIMGDPPLPFVWATVILFRKSKKSQMLFDLVGRIQRNYNYYKSLFNISEKNYRNDYAFAMANIILNGYNTNEHLSIPWPMYTAENKIEKIKLAGNFVQIHYEKTATVVPKMNIHVMDKAYLKSQQFCNFVESVCNE